MSTPRRPRQTLRRRATTGLVAGALPLVLSACGASLDAQTYQERTQAGATNSAVGTLAVRAVYVEPPDGSDRTYEPGDDALVRFTVVNESDEPDRLLEVTSDAAESVVVLVDESPGVLEVPPLDSTFGEGALLLQDLTSGLYEGTYITMTFVFERNGELTVPVPIGTSGTTDRPIFTGDGEHEPALQAPAGGHGEDEEPGGEGGPLGEGIEEPSAEGEVEDAEGAPEGEGEDAREQVNPPSETNSEIGVDG